MKIGICVAYLTMALALIVAGQEISKLRTDRDRMRRCIANEEIAAHRQERLWQPPATVLPRGAHFRRIPAEAHHAPKPEFTRCF